MHIRLSGVVAPDRICRSTTASERFGGHCQVHHQEPEVVAGAQRVKPGLDAKQADVAEAARDHRAQDGHRVLCVRCPLDCRDSGAIGAGEPRERAVAARQKDRFLNSGRSMICIKRRGALQSAAAPAVSPVARRKLPDRMKLSAMPWC